MLSPCSCPVSPVPGGQSEDPCGKSSQVGAGDCALTRAPRRTSRKSRCLRLWIFSHSFLSCRAAFRSLMTWSGPGAQGVAAWGPALCLKGERMSCTGTGPLGAGRS